MMMTMMMNDDVDDGDDDDESIIYGYIETTCDCDGDDDYGLLRRR